MASSSSPSSHFLSVDSQSEQDLTFCTCSQENFITLMLNSIPCLTKAASEGVQLDLKTSRDGKCTTLCITVVWFFLSMAIAVPVGQRKLFMQQHDATNFVSSWF